MRLQTENSQSLAGTGPVRRSLVRDRRIGLIGAALYAILFGMIGAVAAGSPNPSDFLSPTAMIAATDGRTIFVACGTGNRVLLFDIQTQTVRRSMPLAGTPYGLAFSADQSKLIVTCAAPESKICVIDLANAERVPIIPGGHTAMSPALSPDGKALYVCNRFNNDVSVIDLVRREELCRIAVQREPVAAAITKDGKFLLVANHLHDGRADTDRVSAAVTVINLASNKAIKELQLPNGASGLNDLRVSPDGRFAAITHLLGRHDRPTTHLYRGWMNQNALTLIDLAKMDVLQTVLLDDGENGAANPWGIAWSGDGRKLVVTHSGTHEISVIDFPALLSHLSNRASGKSPGEFTSGVNGEFLGDLAFPAGVRRRVKLPKGDLGPRAVVVVGSVAYVANYFSDTLTLVDLDSPELKAESIPLGPKHEMDPVRRGEFLFHDATICFQGWQSCASCHPGDGRADGLNWDLLNDGIGNPKNTKSLLLAFQTPPAMSSGVRDSAQAAVRAGIRHILFTLQPDEVVDSIGEYLKSLKPVPSPHLVDGKLSPAAKRGEKVFDRAGCADCHPPALFTDLQKHDVGTRGRYDEPTDRFDTPTLIELWRTAPYLHDGSAATIRDVVTTQNPADHHGRTSNLSSQEIEELCAYLLSL